MWALGGEAEGRMRYRGSKQLVLQQRRPSTGSDHSFGVRATKSFRDFPLCCLMPPQACVTKRQPQKHTDLRSGQIHTERHALRRRTGYLVLHNCFRRNTPLTTTGTKGSCKNSFGKPAEKRDGCRANLNAAACSQSQASPAFTRALPKTEE